MPLSRVRIKSDARRIHRRAARRHAKKSEAYIATFLALDDGSKDTWLPRDSSRKLRRVLHDAHKKVKRGILSRLRGEVE